MLTKVSKLEVSAGAKVTTVGGWTNLSGDTGFYQNFRADLIRIKAGNHQVGLGATGESKVGHRDGKAFYEETRDNVLGYKRSNASTSSKNGWNGKTGQSKRCLHCLHEPPRGHQARSAHAVAVFNSLAPK